jgi:hypothetical protein
MGAIGPVQAEIKQKQKLVVSNERHSPKRLKRSKRR